MHHALFIYVLYYVSCSDSFLKLGRMEPQYPLLEVEYDKNHWARYIEEGAGNLIGKFVYPFILLHEVCRTNKHFFYFNCRFFGPFISGPTTSQR
jgi:hypothetical protein